MMPAWPTGVTMRQQWLSPARYRIPLCRRMLGSNPGQRLRNWLSAALDTPLHLIPTRLHLIPTRLHLILTRLHLILFRQHLIHARLHPIPSRLHLIHTRLHLIPTRLHPIPSRLHLIPTRLHLIPSRLHLIPTGLHIIPTRLHLNKYIECYIIFSLYRHTSLKKKLPFRNTYSYLLVKSCSGGRTVIWWVNGYCFL
jgi:hypothetical protein